MAGEKTDYDEIIKNLTPVEKKLLLECGKMNISVKKNVSEETIRKKMPDDYLKDFSKSLKNLLSIGLIVRYRPHNYGLSKDGRTVSKKITEKHQNNLYSGLRILMLVD